MHPKEILTSFTDFLSKRDHTPVNSCSLLPPEGDDSLLFVNAGMVQFKNYFLGLQTPPFKRAVSCQRCLRAGGKHNDLENVGFTSRHHTFFQMLGNFSFGDYFKREAIGFAWEYLTDILCLPKEKLWVTVYVDDAFSKDIWLKEIGIRPERLVVKKDDSNFWMMGEIGPCGPCTEVFFDHGEGVKGGPPGSFEEEGDRYIELWNLVFMEYERKESGKLVPLPAPCVDTGMGMERLAAVMSGVTDNYKTEVFLPLLRGAAEILDQSDVQHSSLRVIADHLRASCFLLLDGVVPSNEGRGYVLRRIVRRATRHANHLGAKEPILSQLVDILAKEMDWQYPEIREQRNYFKETLLQEEEKFLVSLGVGLRTLEKELPNIRGKILPGKLAFALYDTYGFPLDLTQTIVAEQGMKVDTDAFETCMATQKQRSRAQGGFATVTGSRGQIPKGEQKFCGYSKHKATAQVLALFDEYGGGIDTLAALAPGTVVLNNTPFYAESGGQVGDCGKIQSIDNGCIFQVSNTLKKGGFHFHVGKMEASGPLYENTGAYATIDSKYRRAATANHSATHLLHAALRKILGSHIKQKGSLVEPGHLRFDFTHSQALTEAQLVEVMLLVNQQIQKNQKTVVSFISKKDALKEGAIALFGEKYTDIVRVLKIGFSTELCGGTHVSRCGDIGCFMITKESGIAAGIRRIEGITGDECVHFITKQNRILSLACKTLKTSTSELLETVSMITKENKKLKRRSQESRTADAINKHCYKLRKNAIMVGEIQVVIGEIHGEETAILHQIADRLRTLVGKSVAVVIACSSSNSDPRGYHYIAAITKDLKDQLPANQTIRFLSQQVAGNGGGREDFAQGGAKLCRVADMDMALSHTCKWLKDKLVEYS